MFNILFEHLFVCQSLLKKRRSPTGGLREAFKESLEGGIFTTSSPRVRSKMTYGASATRFSPTWGNDSYCLEWIDPHRDVSCSSLLVVGIVKGLISYSLNLKCFYGCLEEELLSRLN